MRMDTFVARFVDKTDAEALNVLSLDLQEGGTKRSIALSICRSLLLMKTLRARFFHQMLVASH